MVTTLINHILRKAGINMVDVYVALIVAGRRTLAKVPARLRAAVKAELDALGLDENGNPKEETTTKED